ncbi:hypothetical protein MGSAQ_002300 [marine sediment metagenome]|uniref:Uncharacterized protein n=1 Tax=marine sediment metagenome TaxID=412755 RepID=A0A1B6NS53_9ZZZZ
MMTTLIMPSPAKTMQSVATTKKPIVFNFFGNHQLTSLPY